MKFARDYMCSPTKCSYLVSYGYICNLFFHTFTSICQPLFLTSRGSFLVFFFLIFTSVSKSLFSTFSRFICNFLFLIFALVCQSLFSKFRTFICTNFPLVWRVSQFSLASGLLFNLFFFLYNSRCPINCLFTSHLSIKCFLVKLIGSYGLVWLLKDKHFCW